MGAAGDRQDEPRPAAGGRDQRPLRQPVGGHERGRRHPGGRRRRPGAARARRRSDDPVHRRDPPLQQGPAGRAAARTSRTGPSSSSGRPPRTPTSRSTARSCRACGCGGSSRCQTRTSRPSSGGPSPIRSAAWPASSGRTAAVDLADEPFEHLVGAGRRRCPARHSTSSRARSPWPRPRASATRPAGSRPGWPMSRRRPSRRSWPTTGPATVTTTPPRRSSRASAATTRTRALYWLATMIAAGEDPKFIARRLIISASEDVGNADPRALQVAVAAADALDWIGLPEAQYALAQATTYLATAPEVEPLRAAPTGRRWPISRRPARCRSRCRLRNAGHHGLKQYGYRRRLPLPARVRGLGHRPAVPARRARRSALLPAQRPGLRGDDRRPGWPPAVEAREETRRRGRPERERFPVPRRTG